MLIRVRPVWSEVSFLCMNIKKNPFKWLSKKMLHKTLYLHMFWRTARLPVFAYRRCRPEMHPVPSGFLMWWVPFPLCPHKPPWLWEVLTIPALHLEGVLSLYCGVWTPVLFSAVLWHCAFLSASWHLLFPRPAGLCQETGGYGSLFRERQIMDVPAIVLKLKASSYPKGDAGTCPFTKRFPCLRGII